MPKQITYLKITTELRYRNLTESELTRLIGNDLTMGCYDKIPGLRSADKAKWLKSYYEALNDKTII